MDSDQEQTKTNKPEQDKDEDWGDRFGRRMDDWGDRFGRRMDERGERFGRRMDRWEERRLRRYRRNPSKHLFGGVIFLAIGLIFLLGNMGLVDVDRILQFWPVILIVGGLLKLTCGDPHSRGSGIFWTVIGAIFLLGSLRILPIGWGELWPVLLIGLGVTMLSRYLVRGSQREGGVGFSGGSGSPSGTTDFRDAGSSKLHNERVPPASSNSMVSATAILGGVERRNNSQDFRGGSATAIMGGCEIDLRAASITSPNEAILEVFALWGGIEVKVPPDWTVISQVDPILGGYEDKSQPPREETKRFIIRGPVIMGGIEVKN
jgi:predicted membrane protein